MNGLADILGGGPLWLVSLALFVVLLAAREIGVWAHRLLARVADGAEGDGADEGFILSGVLGLLALLIAFTFGLALDRYEARRALVTAEANAIGTAQMRVQMLQTPEAARLDGLLRRYAETRLAYGRADDHAKPGLARASAQQRTVLQSQTLLAVRPVATTPLGPFVAGAINDVLDRGADREAALAARIPPRVLEILLVYTVVSAGVLGYVLEGAGGRHRVASAVLFVLLTLAISLVLDLDRPREGAIKVSQAPMAQLVESLRASP